MAINFLDPETSYISTDGKQSGDMATAPRSSEILESLITTSEDVSGIELRMLPPMIKDNRTPKVWPFPGYSSLYCLTIVVSDASNQLVGSIDLKGFPRIGDNEPLPINKTIYYWQARGETDRSPNQIHIMCSVLKSKESLRDTAKVLGDIKNDNDYKNVVDTLGKIATAAGNFNAVTDIMMQVAGIVGKYLGNVEDKPLGTVVNSYTTLFGNFDKVGINPYTYPTKNVDFNFQLVVRSAKKEKAMAGNNALESVEVEAAPSAATTPQDQPQEKVEVQMMPL